MLFGALRLFAWRPKVIWSNMSESVSSIRVAPKGSKASPNVRYAFHGDQICASQRTDAMPKAAVERRSVACWLISRNVRLRRYHTGRGFVHVWRGDIHGRAQDD